MKRGYILIIFALTIIVEIAFSIVFFTSNYVAKNDTTVINEITKEVANNYNNPSKYPINAVYSILNDKNEIIFANGDNTSNSLNEAYKNGDVIVDIVIDGNVVGKLLIPSNINKTISKQKNVYIIEMSLVSGTQVVIAVLYFIYLHRTMIKPFDDMKKFAQRIATGNLDIPLYMDTNQNFGAFTESFDIMRVELKKARAAEMEAEKSKRELVARLSHDIKTPIASIKSVSELGREISNSEKEKERFDLINQKADQINSLVTNLFNVTIEELDQLSVNPISIPSYVIKQLISNSDYLNKGNSFDIPSCNLFFDRLRLQQVFDNIFMNSYKYANTNIEIEATIDKEYLIISIKDFGDSINDEELPLLFEKYKRGSNSSEKEGTGLGLYISKKFMELQNGKLEIYNDKPGFRVLVYLRII